MGNRTSTAADVKAMHTDAALRELLRIARRHQHLSQSEAARRACISPGWWKRVERASPELSVSTDTLLDMLQAVGVQPSHLTRIGHHDLAGQLSRRLVFASDGHTAADLQEYLARAPASDEIRQALMITARTLDEIKSGHHAELFADQFPPGRMNTTSREASKD